MPPAPALPGGVGGRGVGGERLPPGDRSFVFGDRSFGERVGGDDHAGSRPPPSLAARMRLANDAVVDDGDGDFGLWRNSSNLRDARRANPGSTHGFDHGIGSDARRRWRAAAGRNGDAGDGGRTSSWPLMLRRRWAEPGQLWRFSRRGGAVGSPRPGDRRASASGSPPLLRRRMLYDAGSCRRAFDSTSPASDSDSGRPSHWRKSCESFAPAPDGCYAALPRSPSTPSSAAHTFVSATCGADGGADRGSS